MLRFLTAGESHGRALITVVDGLPAGLRVDAEKINFQLRRRQAGYGRGGRMKIETDKAEIVSGLRRGLTLGSPLSIRIVNRDFSIERMPAVSCPRPGHADLAGLLKYGVSNIRDVLERASARETAARVAAGSVCRILLEYFGVKFTSRVLKVGGKTDPSAFNAAIDEARKNGDTVGGVLEVSVAGVPAGLGTYAQHDKRLDAALAAAVVSIPGVKAVEFGLGFGYADKPGSECHDPVAYSRGRGYFRKSNNAGGIEGGISNGEEIVVRACMKPICTLLDPLESVNINTKKNSRAAVERSDVAVVEAAGVVGEAVCAPVLAGAFLEKFGGDCLEDINSAYRAYLKRIRK